MRLATIVVLLTIATTGFSNAAEPPQLPLTTWISDFRDLLGKPLLTSVVSLNNRSALVLENISPQGASFGTGDKIPGETFDALRRRSYFAISFTTCSGATSLDAKITSVIAWQTVSAKTDKSANYQGNTAFYLQQLLQIINLPPAISNPSNLRAPRASSLNGVVFEFVKGDTTETLSLLNDAGISPDYGLSFTWQAVNNSFCPKT